jgi:hypothetical protein
LLVAERLDVALLQACVKRVTVLVLLGYGRTRKKDQ